MEIESPIRAHAQAGHEIERPRSALHAGDFTQQEHRARDFPTAFQEDLDRIGRSESKAALGSSPTTPWYKPLPSPRLESSLGQATSSIEIPDQFSPVNRRSRAPSLQSYSSSFVLKPPTSPLVHQSNNEDVDFSPIDISPGPSKSNRRHTLPPHGFQALTAQPMTLVQAARQPPSLQRENSLPYKAHHKVRKSWTPQSPLGASPSLQTPLFLRSRRSSFASDISPIQHASMVGSYEESILRGRMSTMPSKPLDFTAQIGALGKDNCRPKYPAHVSIDFPAVYYSWGSPTSGSNLNEPSPYVGLIDLEHKLEAPPLKEKRRRRMERLRSEDQEGLSEVLNGAYDVRRREKRKRRSPSPYPELLTGGCYRIPQQGQLQILIKNPHKTAVKLFLVPYDLEGMRPGTKTFVRQRCYSAGPIIEKPLTSRSTSELDMEAKLASTDSKSRPMLRYLIQLNICCPSKGRYYLYKNIHVVFANRVPDNKESLRNEILWPEPRYAPWKPSTSSDNVLTSSISNDVPANMRRSKSYGESSQTATSFTNAGELRGFDDEHRSQIASRETFPPLPPIPNKYYGESRTTLKENVPFGSTPAPLGNFVLDQSLAQVGEAGYHPTASLNHANKKDAYTKLSRGEAGYGGLFGRPATPEPGEGLLARKLKGLDVEKEKCSEQH